MLLATLLYLAVRYTCVLCAQNLFTNPNIEDPVASGTWQCPINRCTFARTNVTAHTGKWSLHVQNRYVTYVKES
jgi:hypothetical protein